MGSWFSKSSEGEPPAGDQELDLRCPECGYNLTGAPGDRCSWCGTTIDWEEVATLAVQSSGPRRLSLAISCAIVGLGSLAAVTALTFRARSLSLFDAITVLAVLAAVGGHFYLGVLAVLGGIHWPIHRGEAGGILRLLGWLSIAAAVLGASQALQGVLPAKSVQGVVVNPLLEFAVRAVLFVLPGCMLLALRLVSLRESPGTDNASRRTRHSREDSQSINAVTARELQGLAPFTIIAAGRYQRGTIVCAWSDVPRQTSPAVEERIARTWEAEAALARTENRHLADEPLIRLIGTRSEGSSLHLTLGRTTYREFVGTHLGLPETALPRGEVENLANPLRTEVLLGTSDGYLALIREPVGLHHHAAASLQTVGVWFGVTGPHEPNTPSELLDAFASVRRVLLGLMRFRQEHIVDVTAIGLVRDHRLQLPALLFDVAASPSRSELTTRHPTDTEHVSYRTPSPKVAGLRDRLEWVNDDPEAVLSLLNGTEEVAPSAQAALLLHGKHNWGGDWHEQACYVLYGELPPGPQ